MSLSSRNPPPWRRNREEKKRDPRLLGDTGVCAITESDAPHAAIRAGTTSYLCTSASSEGRKDGEMKVRHKEFNMKTMF